jgi:branched-chain amino acid transport system substrate-binding protein
MKNLKRFLILVLALVLTATFVPVVMAEDSADSSVSSNSAVQDTVKIGTIQPISGPVAAYGVQARDAIIMAVDEINAKGGVLGTKLELIVEDDEANPEKTKNAFTKLVAPDGVLGVIGALTSKCSLAITKDAQAKKVIIITPTSTNDLVTNAGNYIFRACYKDSFQAPMIAKFAANNLKTKKAAILYDNTNDYSVIMRDNFKKGFEKLGGKIVSEATYSTMDKDFNSQLIKIKKAKPEIIFLPDYYPTVSLVAKQAKFLNINIPMLGADGWDEIANNSGDEIVGSYYCNHYSSDSKDALVKSFVKRYRAKYNCEPNVIAALAYDSTYILAEAIVKAGSTNTEKIRAKMAETNKKYVTGKIKFDKNGNAVKSVVMLKLVKGSTPNNPKAAYFATVEP